MIARLAAAALLLSPANAFFILHHSQSLTKDRLDPLVNPGGLASHVHNIVGASNFGPTLTPELLKASTCTTSPVTIDKSNYWAPQLYHKNDNGSLSAIPISFVQTYYFQRGENNSQKVKAFPEGFRMLAGEPYRSTYNTSNLADRAVSYVCLNYKGGDGAPYPYFPNTTCADGLRAQIVFPSCWDGKNLDSADHKSHMAYPDGVDSGNCPSTHPVKLATLFNEWVFDVGKFDGYGSDHWVWATGSDKEFGFHADFVNGWEVSILQDALDQCTGNLFDGVENCPPFAKYVDRTAASSCTTPSKVQESIGFTSALTKLPGCNPIPAGSSAARCPGAAVPAIAGVSSGSPATGASSSSASSPASASTASSSTASETSPETSSAAAPSSSNVPVQSSSAENSASATSSHVVSTTPTPVSSAPVRLGATHSVPRLSTAIRTASAPHASKTTGPHSGTCKRSNRESSAAAAAAAAAAKAAVKHKRAVHEHVRRHVNRLAASH